MKNQILLNCIIILGGIIILFLFLIKTEEENIVKDNKSVQTEVFIDIENYPLNKPIEKKEENIVENSTVNNSNEPESLLGELPPLTANYREHVGFKKYADSMIRFGARFFVIGDNSNKLYEIDFNKKSLNITNLEELNSGSYCSKSRIITGEPSLEYYKTLAKKEYQMVNPEIHVITPLKLEKRLLAELMKYPSLNLAEVILLKGYYVSTANGMKLILNKAVIPDKTMNINIEIII